MRELPDDLIPLPTAPYDRRPASMPLDVDECRTAIWRCDGNVTRAAELIKVSTQRLRTFIKNHDRLRREVEEASEQLIDKAEDVVREALSDPDRADQMARFVLQTKGRSRGWGNGSGSGVVVNNNGGSIEISWADGTSFAAGDDAKVIEGSVVDVDRNS